MPDKSKLPDSLEQNLAKDRNINTRLTNLTTEKSSLLTLKVIELSASTKELSSGFTFRSWTYTIVVVKLALDGKGDEVYVDIGYGVTLIDWE